MKKLLVLLVLSFLSGSLVAQSVKPRLSGEYLLEGVMETASGFKLNADSTFQFFYSVGALDRYGSGKWSVYDSVVVFNTSKPRPAKDFAMITSRQIPGNLITIKIVEKNTVILPFTECSIKSGPLKTMKRANEEGFARFQKQDMDAISLLFTLCPDRPSVFPVSNATHNYYEFRIEPWIAEVFFEDFFLKIDHNRLMGDHPLLKGMEYSYVKP
jgi:hypothetical protein